MTFLPKTVLVLGTGTMGQGIAQVVASASMTARLFDVDPAKVAAAIAQIGVMTGKSVQKGKMTEASRGELLARLVPCSKLSEAARDIDLAIEAIPEKMELKVSVLSEVRDHAPASAILGSNTSSLSLTELGARLGCAERVVGLHFFNPPPVMELLEIVRGLSTSVATEEACLAFAKAIGKTPIVVNDSPGFATSRLGVILGCEAIRMLESGVASAADIDRAMELGYRHPMGPLKLSDLVGLDVRLGILEHLHRELGEQFRPPALLRQMVRAGKLGKKSGEGFYRWTAEGPVLASERR